MDRVTRTGLLQRMGIEPSEARMVAWAAVCLAIVGGSDVSLANVAETYFLKRVGVEYLPLAFLASSLILVATSYGVGRFAVPRSRETLLPRVFLVLAAALLLLWLLVHLEVPGIFAVLILVTKQFKVIALLVYWVTMGDLLHGRQAKRIYPPLIAGFTVGSIAGSFASQPVGEALGLEGILYVTAGLLLVGAVTSLPLVRMRGAQLDRALDGSTAPARGTPEPPRIEREGGLGALWAESRLFRILLVMVLCGGGLAPMLYFQFSYTADLATQGADGEQRLLALYAQLRGWINAAILVAQLLFTSALFRRIGLPLSALFTPLFFLLGFVGLGVEMSLRAGISAVAGTRLQAKAIYEPAMRVLFNLFPEKLRARATAVLEGPVDRLGGALGNLAVLGVLTLGSAVWVSYVAIPIAALWLGVTVWLWRSYPTLLLSAAARRAPLGDAREQAELLDRSTLQVLAGELLSPDPRRCSAAIDLVLEADPEDAAAALAGALADAPADTRSLLVAALDHICEGGAESLQSAAVASSLVSLLEDGAALPAREGSDLLRLLARSSEGSDFERARRILEQARRDPQPAVRLVAGVELDRLAPSEDGGLLDRSLAEALHGDDVDARRAARKELRSLLLAAPDAEWEERLLTLSDLLSDPGERSSAAEALSDIALRHGPRAAQVAEAVVDLRGDSDPSVRASLLRFIGRAGLEDHVSLLVESLASDRDAESKAARDGLLALGPRAANPLLVAYGFGKRSTRDAILSILRDLEVEAESIRSLYERELDGVRQAIVALRVLSEAEGDGDTRLHPIVLQRLEERADEGLRTALLFLAALHREERIAKLEPDLRRSRGERRHAILMEALEALLDPSEKKELVPLLEDVSIEVRARVAESRLASVPDYREASTALLNDPDELTRALAVATWPDGLDPEGELARRAYSEEHSGVLNPVEIALQFKTIPLFERLSTRQLMDLADVVREEKHRAGDVLCSEGDELGCMYFIVDGEAAVTKGERVLAELGPSAFFGEMSLFNNAPRSATVTAKTAIRLLRLERHDLMAIMDEIPGIAIGMCQALSSRMREMNIRV